MQADELVILTGVDYVAVDYLKPTERALKRVTTEELKGYIKEKQFAEGSMLPKVKAAIQFAEAKRQQNGHHIPEISQRRSPRKCRHDCRPSLNAKGRAQGGFFLLPIVKNK